MGRVVKMDRNAIAKKLIADGHSQARLVSRLRVIAKRLGDSQLSRAVEQLEANRIARCATLQEAACHADAGLEPDVVTLAAVPKERPADD